MTTIEMIKILSPIIALNLVLMVTALLSLRKSEVANLSKPIWAIIVIVINLFGPILYFTVGRKKYD